MTKDDRYAHLGGETTADEDADSSDAPTVDEMDDDPTGLRVRIETADEDVVVDIEDESVTVADVRKAIRAITDPATDADETPPTPWATSLRTATTAQRSALGLTVFATGVALGGAVTVLRARRSQ